MSRTWRRNLPLLLMFVPVILFFVVFKYVPIGGAIIAFKKYNLMEGVLHSPWVGMDNFRMLFSTPTTLEIIRNTLMLSLLSIVVGFPFPIVLAILLNEVGRMWFKRIVQTLVYLPHFFSWIIVSGIIVTVFSQQNGLVNGIWESLTGQSYPFLYREGSWLSIFVGSGVWKEAGFSAIIYLAALSGIDPTLYEAAEMDGASRWRQMWHVTLPGLRVTIVLMLILSLGRVMEVGFDQVYMLQNSSVSDISEVISTYIYKVGLMGSQFSLTAAIGLFESLVGLVLVLGANAVAKKFGSGLW
ncbi:ABC transporter permease subunit [Saccharibacillus sp. CPCC 101409]|uniref:ABC transporter permease n=1 Tax=Saccharibacillus sp. CPCC 101409 TaxID=3058041 RepID=UPI0026715B80|nr:ABC transporter permease subunit [Saccharibacillus sp. CPCC 101409]MDO3408686.1 ABC transporter permease subunit [Saccharibacillus sp. CPCC 101409]